MLQVKLKRLSEWAIMPTYGSEKAACMDLYANLHDVGGVNQKVTIQPHETVKIGIGWAMTPPEGYFGAIVARSGLSSKQGLRPANAIRICDQDYTGEYIIALHNDSAMPREVHHGDRIAQLMFMPYEQINFVEVNELDATERGAGGFGSTGVQ